MSLKRCSQFARTHRVQSRTFMPKSISTIEYSIQRNKNRYIYIRYKYLYIFIIIIIITLKLHPILISLRFSILIKWKKSTHFERTNVFFKVVNYNQCILDIHRLNVGCRILDEKRYR